METRCNEITVSIQRDTRRGICVREVCVPKYLSHDSRKGGSRGGFLGALGFVYLPTYIGCFLPAGPPLAVSRGEYIPARRFTGVWLGESQEACALLTMTNCPALRRHIYANLGARVESPPPRTYEFTRVLLPLLDASRRPTRLPSHPSERRNAPHRRFHATSKIRWITNFASARVKVLFVFASSLAKQFSQIEQFSLKI